MGTTLHTFIDIFDYNYEMEGENVQLSNIVIPIIQRDYAQGRVSDDVNRKRERFLDALKEAVVSKPITLDFVYGDISKDGVMTPLDGQQRLTTLFLLHWYAAKKDKIDEKDYSFLSKFSYETRYSARDFCHFLINFNPSFDLKLSDDIIEQNWFPLDWKKDPTISSMLVMLDAINEKFSDVSGLWEKLVNKAITFYFLPIKDMGLTDELYIKMNSRGKPLTDFEHFKAEFERELKLLDEDYAKNIINKIDIDWTDLLWNYRGDDNIIDDEFLRYFNFICDIICYKNGNTPLGKSSNEFDLLKEYFTGDKENVKNNVQLLETYFDCWCKKAKEKTIKEFFESFVSYEHCENKVKIDTRIEVNLFEACLRSFGNKKQFTLPKIVLLYGVITYLLNEEKISKEQFTRRFRILNNLVRNSEDEIHNDENRDGGNRIPAILKQTDNIIIKGSIDLTLGPSFNLNQLNEEIEKNNWLANNKDKSETLFKLEDHDLLFGQIGVIGLENIDLASKFEKLFNCNWDKVDCALLATEDYRQQNMNKWRYQMGSSKNPLSWEALFHKSKSKGYDNTRNALKQLLVNSAEITDENLQNIIDSYVDHCEKDKIFDWRYYYIKYPVFRPGRYGKYYIKENKENPDLIRNYELVVMWTNEAVSTLAYQPFLKEIDSTLLSKDDWGMKLIANDVYVICENSGYKIFNLESNELIKSFDVPQNEDGIDLVNRIEAFKNEILEYLHK